MSDKKSSLEDFDDQAQSTDFGTKAETLERLRPILKNAIILPQIHFNIRQWQKYATNIIENIQRHFHDDLLAVRSSALLEDTVESSRAGAFCSVLNVDRGSAMAIRSAIDRVIESYDDEDPNNQILIQPQLTDVAMCGVMLTCDIERGAPYYVINYDESGATDKVTSGVSDDQQTHYIYRLSDLPPDDEDIAKLIDCAKELEAIMGNNALDIEFAFDNNKQLYLFQVRPLAEQAALDRFRSSDIHTLIQKTRSAINACNTRKGGIAGKKTVLSDMSDWNPAELIGSHPRPLSHSLFEDLITNSTWRKARGELGYFDPQRKKLLITLAGRPYVDVRNSFNSLMPNALTPQ